MRTKEHIRRVQKIWNDKNKDRRNEKKRMTYPEIRASRLISAKKYRDKNREKINQKAREFRKNNKDKIREYQKKYISQNREKYLASANAAQKKRYEIIKKDKEKWKNFLQVISKWQKNNPDKVKKTRRIWAARPESKKYLREIYRRKKYGDFFDASNVLREIEKELRNTKRGSAK